MATSQKGKIVGILAVVGILFFIVANAKSDHLPTKPTVQSAPTPDTARLESLACAYANADAGKAISQVGKYIENRSTHLSVSKALRITTKALDSDWKPLTHGPVYTTILSLANDVDALSGAIAKDNYKLTYVHLGIFKTDLEQLQVACR